MTDAETIVRAYYAAFNAQNMSAFFDLLTPDIIHDISQGGRQVGLASFRGFMDHMNRCYAERIEDLVVMTASDGTRAAAEFTVHGRYLATDPDVPPGTAPARGQGYVLPAGAFFTLRGGRIARVSNHYNLGDWVRQVAL